MRIKIDMLGYAIDRVWSQLTSDDLGQWQAMAYFSYKMIPAKTQYKIHNGKFLAIIGFFKICPHYLEGCKYKIFVFINYNNFCRFIDIKSLSFCQVW